jgi:conjugative transposon TraM protein
MNMNSSVNEEKSGLTRKQRELMKKMAVFSLMGIICAGSIFLIFAPSADEKAKKEQEMGFNADIPMPKEKNLIGDKRDAYEQEQMKQKQEERMRSLNDFSSLLEETGKKQSGANLTLLPDEPASPQTGGSARQPKPAPVQNSMNAYKDINRTLGSFYEKPREDPEKEHLKQELEELKSRMDEPVNTRQAVENQLALVEKSFQMAAKYMPGTLAASGTSSGNTAEPAQGANAGASGKTAIVPVTHFREQTVSILQGEMSDAEFIKAYSQPRNRSFLTATGEANTGIKNTVSAAIHANQTVMTGQTVRLRLLESVQAGNMYIPRGMLLSGTAKIQDERLDILVLSLENTGVILPVSLTVYDLDGQRGIFIPDLQALNAAKEIIAGMGTSAGTSVNLSNDAEKQFVADMGRNVIQGVSQFTAKKLREIKVHLKAGYRVYLVSEGNLNINPPQLADNKSTNNHR